jgi:uncharacterized protein YoxC
MLETSKDILYIAISVAVLAVSGYLSYLLYSVTKLIQESKKTVEDVNKKLEKVNPVLDSATNTVKSLSETIQAINDGILKPIASISEVIKKVKTIQNIFTKNK